MHVLSLQCDGVRILGDRSFSFGNAPGIVAVTGPPASGKSTLLEALIVAKEDVGAYGAGPTPTRLLGPGLTTAKLNVTWKLSPHEQERFALSNREIATETIIGGTVVGPPHDPAMVTLLSEYDADPGYGKMEYFHANRDLPRTTGGDLSKGAGDAFDRRQRLANANDKYGNLVRFIVSSGMGVAAAPGGPPPEPGRVSKAFAALCSSKRLGGLYQKGDSLFPAFVDAAGAAYGVAELSGSERDALILATTFVRAGLVDNQVGACILVDAPERHLGDSAGTFVRALHGLGRHNQIIVATASRAVVEAADVVVHLGAS